MFVLIRQFHKTTWHLSKDQSNNIIASLSMRLQIGYPHNQDMPTKREKIEPKKFSYNLRARKIKDFYTLCCTSKSQFPLL